MKLNPAHFAEFRTALITIDPTAFGLAEVEIYPGATVLSRRSTVVCTFDGAAEDKLHRVGEEAARLIEAQLGLAMAWGVHAGDGQRLQLWIEYFPGGARYSSAKFALQALRAAFAVVLAASSGGKAHAEAAERETARLGKAPVGDIFPCLFVIAAAREADLPVENIGGYNVAWQFGWGRRSEIFFISASLGDSLPGHQISWRKHIAKQTFREIGIPTPKWRVIAADGDALRAAEAVGWPCVVKPLDRAFGAGVTANIANPDELRLAVAVAGRMSRKIMIEAHEPGDDHRLMIVDGRLMAAIRRVPAEIKGDGRQTVEQLITALNAARDGSRETGFLEKVTPDAAFNAKIAANGMSLSSVLPKGTTLQLRTVANVSAGGTPTDVTDKVHPQIRGMAELLAVSLGLRAAGMDYVTSDISRSHAEVGGGFIEVNAMARVRVLIAGGRSEQEVGALLIGERPGRIPVTLIVGDSKALAELAGPVRARVEADAGSAAVSLDWAQIGETQLPMAGLDPFAAVAGVLRHLAVEDLVILWTPAEIARFGLPVDQIARTVLIGAATAGPCIAQICPDLVTVADANAALEAAFAWEAR